MGRRAAVGISAGLQQELVSVALEVIQLKGILAFLC